ncbi:MAG: bile acid:sodium symporter family protein [Bacteroidetes bacterium]|nr:MAG: bile acid:sodium symporter family protein [Bacteroidota bacterium]
MYEQLLQLDNIRLNFNPDGLFALNVTLGIIMFGVALGIKMSNFKKIVTMPKAVIVGVLSQFVFLPAMSFLLVVLMKDYVTQGVALGIILVAACPGGNISNFISSLAKGNVELSVSLTAVATVLAVFLTPLNFAFWGGLYLEYGNTQLGTNLLKPITIDKYQMFLSVFVVLGLPLILGMLFSWKLPKITKKITKPIQTISIVIFMSFVVIAFVKNYEYFIDYIQWIMVIVLIHNALALLTGFSLASIFGVRRRNRRSITIETGIQNSGLALVLLFNDKIFDPDLPLGGMLFIAAWWGIWHIISGLGLAALLKRVPLKTF